MLVPGLLLSLRPSSSPQISVLLHGLLFTRYYPSIYTLLNALTDAPCRHFSHHPVPTFLDCYSPILSPLILPYFIVSYSTPRNLRSHVPNIHLQMFRHPQSPASIRIRTSLPFVSHLHIPLYISTPSYRDRTSPPSVVYLVVFFALSVPYQSPPSLFLDVASAVSPSSASPLTPLFSTWQFHSTLGSSSGLFARTGKRSRKTRRKITSLPSPTSLLPRPRPRRFPGQYLLVRSSTYLHPLHAF